MFPLATFRVTNMFPPIPQSSILIPLKLVCTVHPMTCTFLVLDIFIAPPSDTFEPDPKVSKSACEES